MTHCHDILDWHLFAFSIAFMFWCLFLSTHIIMTFLNSIFNFSCLADASNYASWVINVKFVLMNKDLWAVVSGTSFKPVVELDDVNTLNLKFSPEYNVWSRKNDRACATIALSCQDGLKRFIQNLSAHQMWLKLKKLYEVQGFNVRYLTFTTLLSHHYDLSKFIESYVDQLKTLSWCLQEMNSTFSDWVILTVLLNNLEFTFNAFIMAKHQFICVMTFTFNFLAAELIDKARMKNNKSFIAMAFCDKSKLSLSLQCLYCKKTGHEEPMCFAKYPHKKKKLNAAWAVKKKGKSLLSDKFSGKSFNNVKSTSDKTDDNVTTLSFMFVIGSHLMSVWIVDTEASNHLCSTRKFFLTYEPISKSLKTANEPAQIIEKNMVSLCLVHSDGGIQEVILKDIMHASDFSANLVSDCCMRVDDIFFDMHDCTIHHKNNNVIEYTSEVNRIFQLHLNDTSQSHAFAANCEFKVLFDMWHWCLSHLGHTNIKCLFKIINSIDLKDLSQWHDVCELCMKVKQTHCPYNAFIEWVTWSLNLIHLNVVEFIMLIVYDSSRWFVILTDDFTRFIWMFFMKIKDKTVKHIKNFVALMKISCSDYSLECLLINFECEYLVLKDWFSVNDIIWEPTTFYSPEENGVSEQLNCTICKSAQAMLKDFDLNSHLWQKVIKTAVYIKNQSSTWVLNITLYEAWTDNIFDLSSLCVFDTIAWAHIFKEQHQQEVKFEDCSLKCHYLDMKESSIFYVWDSESEQVLESHNCFVDENITAYENLANIEVHSKKKTTSTSNHVVNSSSAFSLLLLQPSFVSEEVSASATLLLQFLLLQQSNSVSMHSLSSFVSEKASTSSCCQFELMSSNTWVLDKLSDSDELSSLNPSASAVGSLNPSASAVGSLNPSASAAASCYNLCSCSVVDESDAHVSYVYVAISIDNIIEPTTYKQTVKSPLCDKWKMTMKNEIQSLKNNNTWDIVNMLSDQHVLKECWVYKVKRDAHGQVSCYKACWVVKGYEQQFDIDYDQIFVSVIKLQTYKTLFALATHYDLEVNQINVTTAFLYDSID